MKAWLRCVRGMRGLAAAGLIAALAGAVSWGQAPPEEMMEQGEPPMVEPPMSPQSPALPNPPFTLPSPTPLPPEQAAPFVPALPMPGANPLEPPAPLVRLRVQAPARVEPDKEIEYRLTVENVSAAAAHHVLVRDRLPRGVEQNVRAEPRETKKETKDGDTDLLWELGTLKPGEQKVIVLAVKPKGNEDVQNRAYVQFEHGQKVTTRISSLPRSARQRGDARIAKPSVRAKATAPPQAMRYEEITFRIEVANTGAAPLRGVVVNDELPPGLEFVSGKPEPHAEKPLTWKLGDVPPQQTRRIEYKAIVKQTGTFRNHAKVTAAGGASATDSAAVMVGEPKLKISISGPPRRLVNRPIPYHITVGNAGTVPLTSVQVSDELPPGGFEFVSASAGGRREGGFVRWTVGNLAPGELRSLLLVLRSPAPGRCWNQVKAQADHELSAKALSEMTRIESTNSPVIEIDKTTDWLLVGQKAIYTIRLFNPGKNNISNPRVFVNVPDEMSITAERGETTGRREGQKVVFDPLKVLGGGEEKGYTVEVVAKKAGEAKLRASWTNDGRPESSPTEPWEDTTIIFDPAQMANRVAAQAQTLQARYFLGALSRYFLGAVTRSRLPCWTWENLPLPIR
jgi:uncharacterized repeat protein (TIGR01451 family)